MNRLPYWRARTSLVDDWAVTCPKKDDFSQPSTWIEAVSNWSNDRRRALENLNRSYGEPVWL